MAKSQSIALVAGGQVSRSFLVRLPRLRERIGPVKAASGYALNTGGTESVQVGTAAGKIYVVNLVGFGATPGNYQVDLMFTSP